MSSTDDGTSPTGDVPSSVSGRRRPRLRYWVASALVALFLAHGLVLETFTVPGGSMEPTLHPGDRILVRKVAVEVRRGDVIVFDARAAFGVGAQPGPARRLAEQFGIRTDGAAYVKRVIGMGGDRVRMGADGVIHRNGQVVHEPYARRVPTETPFDVQVPPGRLFVLGDNRASSDDSSKHLGDPGGGTVPRDDVIGTVVVRYWPLNRAGGLPAASSPGRGVVPNVQTGLAR